MTRSVAGGEHRCQPLIDLLHRFADEKGVTPAQISLAWMLAKEDFIAPIPGSQQRPG